MDDESVVNLPHPIYLVKVLIGLALMGIVIFAANWLPLSNLPLIQERLVLAVLLLLSLAMIPVVRLIYLHMDELQRTLHTRSSRATLPVLASLFCLVGVLQASHIIPLFNQFWTLGVLVALWGINLMLSDRHFK